MAYPPGYDPNDPWSVGTPPFNPQTQPSSMTQRLMSLFRNPDMLSALSQVVMAQTGKTGGYAGLAAGEERQRGRERERQGMLDTEQRGQRIIQNRQGQQSIDLEKQRNEQQRFSTAIEMVRSGIDPQTVASQLGITLTPQQQAALDKEHAQALRTQKQAEDAKTISMEADKASIRSSQATVETQGETRKLAAQRAETERQATERKRLAARLAAGMEATSEDFERVGIPVESAGEIIYEANEAKRAIAKDELSMNELRSRIDANIAQSQASESTRKLNEQEKRVQMLQVLGGDMGKPLGADAAKTYSIVKSVIPEAEELKSRIKADKRGAVLGMLTGMDPDISRLVDQVADKVGRLRSGGAINKDEEERFKAQVVRIVDVFSDDPTAMLNALDRLIAEAVTVAQQIRPGTSVEQLMGTAPPAHQQTAPTQQNPYRHPFR